MSGNSPSNEEALPPKEAGSQEFTPAIAFAMGEIKGTVENLRTDLKEWKGDLLNANEARDAAVNGKFADHETRIRSLEKRLLLFTGFAAAGGFAGGAAIDGLLKLLGG